MDSELATTYALIHAFLIRHTHTKAAQALKKSVRHLIVLRDDVIPEGPPLGEIIRQWKIAAHHYSDSESPSSSSDSDAGIEQPVEVAPPTTKKKKAQSSSSSASSDSDESDSDHSPPSSKGITAKNKLNVTEHESSRTLSSNGHSRQGLASEADTSDEESDEEVSEPEANTRAQTESDDSDSDTSSEDMYEGTVRLGSNLGNNSKCQKTKNRNATSSASSSAVTDPESDSDAKEEASAKAKRASTPAPETDSSSSSESETHTSPPAAKGKRAKEGPRASQTQPESGKANTNTKDTSINEHHETRVTKKRRMDAEGKSMPTPLFGRLNLDPLSSGKNKKRNHGPGTANDRFMRVDPTKLQSFVNNSYVSKDGPTNDYGKRAHQDLFVTRGAGFRKEKNKKKKGSYHGGEITMQSHSFKFT